MADRKHSPTPFSLAKATEGHGHLILDAFGDSMGALAARTGDHSAEEQLANALLFTASGDLLEAGEDLVAALDGEPDLDPASLAALATLKFAIKRAKGLRP